MDKEFLQLFLTKTQFPSEAAQELLRCSRAFSQTNTCEALGGAIEFFYEHDCDMKLVTPLIEEISRQSGVHVYTVWLLFLIQCALPAKEAYLHMGISEEIFWATFEDLRYKALECKSVHGVWGNFVSSWYPIFYTCDIVKLGRLEYEGMLYEEDVPYEGHGISLQKGAKAKVKSIHIPSSGEPFDFETRLASYKMAYEFYKDELNGKPLVCICDSWLLHPNSRAILSPTSNIVDFMNDFEIITHRDEDTFHDAWRVFGSEYQKPCSDLPEKTSMQRAFKKLLLDGKKTGEGCGILIFDGEKLLTRKV